MNISVTLNKVINHEFINIFVTIESFMCQVEVASPLPRCFSDVIVDLRLNKFVSIDSLLNNLIVLAFTILINKTESLKLTESNRDSIVTS